MNNEIEKNIKQESKKIERKISSNYIILVLIVFSFFLFNLVNIDANVQGDDEATYYYQGRLILHPELYEYCQTDPQHCDIYPPKDFFGFPVNVYTEHPPFGKYLFAFALLFNESIIAQRVFILILGALTILVVFFLSKELYDGKIAIFSSLLIALSLPFVIHSRYVFPDIPMTLFILLSIFFFYKGFKRSENISIILGGFFSGLAILTKYPAFALLPIIVYIFYKFLLKVKFVLKEFSFDISIENKKILKPFFISLIILFLVGIGIYNIIAFSLYGFFPLQKNIEYESAVGHISAKSFDIIGFLASLNESIVLFPLLLLGIVYFLMRRRPEDIIVLLGFFIFAVYSFLQGHVSEFFAPPRVHHYLVPIVPFAAIMLSNLIFFINRKIEKSNTKILVFVIIGMIAVAHLVFYAPYYMKPKDDDAYKAAIKNLNVSKETPILVAYSILGLKFYYGWKYTYAIDNLQPYEIKNVVQNNLNKSFAILIDNKWQNAEKTLTVLRDICPREDISYENKTIFYLYKCNL